MSSLFASLIKQALITFDQRNITAFTTNFKILKQLANQLTANDINLNSRLLLDDYINRSDKAPCTYVHILQTKDVSMSVFILKTNYTMPLHDHPMMHGILKVLKGELLIHSYTKKLQTSDEPTYICGAREICVKCEEPNLVTELNECAILTPKERNFHEITAINGIAAFFDILSPPYDSDIPIYGKRKCSFYHKVNSKHDELNLAECTLIKIPSPMSYYCDTDEYDTPNFMYEIVQNYKKESDNNRKSPEIFNS